ncbi:MAG: helix-turn-helix transcriptional regulator [Planctomycetota bacterium]
MRDEDPTLIELPADTLPEIHLATHAFHNDRAFSTTYQAPHHTLHVYGYPGVIRLGQHQLDFHPGSYTLTPAGIPARYDLPRGGHHWCVHFRCMQSTTAPLRLPLLGTPPEEVPSAGERIAQIALLTTEHSPTAQRRAPLLLQDLLLSLAPTSTTNSTTPSRTRTAGTPDTPPHVHPAVRRAAHSLVHQLDQPLDVPRLAAAVGLSQNYLAKLFRDHYGQTLQAYLAQQRIARADLLLRTTDLTIKAIAAQVGYPDPQHFNKTFRRLIGVAPSARRT